LRAGIGGGLSCFCLATPDDCGVMTVANAAKEDGEETVECDRLGGRRGTAE